MGGQASSRATADTSIPACLQVLASETSALSARRAAFEKLQAEFAPSIVGSTSYAAELRRVFALRFDPWVTATGPYLPDGATRLTEQDLADRIRGLIFGSALGDAVGLSTEFMSRAQVTDHYPEGHNFRPGADVYPDTHRMMFPKSDWTDDTDQLLLILQTLLEHGGRYHDSFAARLVEWKDKGFAELGDQGGAGLGRSTKTVLEQPDFLADPAKAAHRVWRKQGGKIAPNGAVMRTAVTGIASFWDASVVEANTLNFCQATHADPRCAASCVVVAECVRLLLLGEEAENQAQVGELIDRAVAIAEAQLLRSGQKEACLDEPFVGDERATDAEIEQWRAELRQYASAESIDALELDEPQTIGYTFKCMGCALWAFRSSANDPHPFAKALCEVTRAGGDADTNGAVAGALIGARIGFSCLPQDWVAELAYGVWLEAWVQKLLWMFMLPVAAKKSTV